MAEPRHQELMTVEELLALPEDGYRSELQAGLLVQEPPPVLRHARTVARLGAILEGVASVHGAVVVTHFGLILAREPDTVRAPDLAVFTREQWEGLDPDRPIEGVPALVIEIRSPSDRPADLHAKVADYLAAGVPMVWLVDPWSCTVRTYPSLLAPVILGADAALDGGSALPGLDLRVRDVFDPDLPPPR